MFARTIRRSALAFLVFLVPALALAGPVAVFPSKERAGDAGGLDYNSTAQASGGARGIRLYLDITAETGTATLDVKLQGRDSAGSGDWFDVPGATFAQKSATGSDDLVIYPGIAETANESVSDVLPSWWRVVGTVGASTADTLTFSVGADLLY